jgi:hypothetical protein
MGDALSCVTLSGSTNYQGRLDPGGPEVGEAGGEGAVGGNRRPLGSGRRGQHLAPDWVRVLD